MVTADSHAARPEADLNLPHKETHWLDWNIRFLETEIEKVKEDQNHLADMVSGGQWSMCVHGLPSRRDRWCSWPHCWWWWWVVVVMGWKRCSKV